MSKTELIKKLSEITGDTHDKTRAVVNAVCLLAWQELRAGRPFAIFDLVEIRPVDVPARQGVAMGRPWSKPAHKGLKAKIIGKAKRMFEVTP